jgi:hypothetical protein
LCASVSFMGVSSIGSPEELHGLVPSEYWFQFCSPCLSLWLAYFAKINPSSVFVHFDTVIFFWSRTLYPVLFMNVPCVMNLVHFGMEHGGLDLVCSQNVKQKQTHNCPRFHLRPLFWFLAPTLAKITIIFILKEVCIS